MSLKPQGCMSRSRAQQALRQARVRHSDLWLQALGTLAGCTLFLEVALKCVQVRPMASEVNWGLFEGLGWAGGGGVAITLRSPAPPLKCSLPCGVSPEIGVCGPPPARPSCFLLLGHVSTCLAGFAVAQCINQHSSPSLSSTSASGSPSGSGSASHCDSGGTSSSSTPSATQSPSGMGRVTRCGVGVAGGLRGTLRSLRAETADPHPAPPCRRVWGLRRSGFCVRSDAALPTCRLG